MHLYAPAIIFALSLLVLTTISHAATSPSIQTHGEITYDTQGLRTSGTTIIDSSGNRFVPKSTTVDWNEWNKGYFTTQDLQTIKSYGGNMIEYQDLVDTSMVQNGVNEAYFTSTIDNFVSLAEQVRIYCIINMFSLGGTGDINLFDTSNSYSSLRQNYVNLWQFIANRYKSSPYVLFSPINEPFNGASLSSSEQSRLGQCYSIVIGQVVSAIRSTGANQIVLVDVPYVGDYSNVYPVDGSGVVWEDHVYVTPSSSINEWKTHITNTVISKYVNNFQRPLFVGEYGPFPHDMSGWNGILSQQVAYLKNSVIAGYSYHTYGVLSGETYNIFNQADSAYILQTIFE